MATVKTKIKVKAKTKTKKIATVTSIEKKVQAALDALNVAKTNGEASASALANNSKKLLAEVKRLAKKRTTLLKKKKTAETRLKKAPTAENRKAVSTADKDLAAVIRDSKKARTAKAAVVGELKLIRSFLKQASTYLSVIDKADKLLDKPKKKKRAAKAKS